jgi:hypothetical protein
MPADEDAAQQSDGAPRNAWSAGLDIATLGAVGLTLFVFLKAYGAAEFSLTTASALISAAPLSVVLGTLISYTYALLPLVSLASLAWLVTHVFSKPRPPTVLLGIAAVIAIVAGALSPWQYLWPWLAVLALPLAFGWMGRRWNWVPSPATLSLYYFFLAGLIVFVSTMTWVWTPVEVVTYREGGGEHSRLVAHVVNTEAEWTTLLTADSRRIVRLRSGDVEHRQTCHYKAQRSGRRPLYYVFLGKEYTSPNHWCSTYCRSPELSIPPLPVNDSALKRCRR